MASTAQTIKFNVGGTHYEVSKSLLENFKDSLLERSASKVWNEGDDEVFIEGNGHRFQYVLDFMRHEKVTLPSSESSDAFLTEMKYYGIACDLEHVRKCGDDSIPNLFSKLTEARNLFEVEKFAILLAHDVLEKYCDINSNSSKDKFVHHYGRNNDNEKEVYNYLKNLGCHSDKKYKDITAKVNAVLKNHGLNVVLDYIGNGNTKMEVTSVQHISSVE